MDAIIERLNSAGAWFVEFAVPMLVQSGVLIVILLAVDLALRKRVRAVFRYWIWLLVLAKLVLPSSLSSPLSLGYFLGDELAEIKISEAGIQEEPFDWRMIRPAPPLKVPAGYDIGAGTSVGTERPIAPVESGVAEEFPKIVTSPVTRVSVAWQGVVFLVWAVVVSAMGLLLLQRAMFVRGLVAQAKEPNRLMKETLEFCRGQMGLKGKVRLKVSTNAASPAVCGLFRPVILVPANLGRLLGSRDLRAVLLHELAHIKRGDLWLNLAQTVLQIVYFYNPLLWFANAMIRRVREQAVDEMVLVAMGDKAKSYPETLVNVAKLAFKQPMLSLRLIGVVESKNALAGRIKRILTRPLPKTAKLGILGLVAVLIIGAVLLPMAKAEKKDVGVEEFTNAELYQKQGSIRYALEFVGMPEELIDTTFVSKRGQLANPRQLEFANKLFSVRKSKDVDMFISLLSDGTKKQLNDDDNNKRMLHHHIKEVKNGTFLYGEYDFKFFVTFRKVTEKLSKMLKKHVSFAETPSHAIHYWHFHKPNYMLIGESYYLIEDEGSYKIVTQTLLSDPIIPVKKEQPTGPKEYGIVSFKQDDDAYTQPNIWKYQWNIELSTEESEKNTFQILKTTKVISGQAVLHPEIAVQKIIDESVIEKYKYKGLQLRFRVGDNQPNDSHKYGQHLSAWSYGYSIANTSKSTQMLFPGKDVTNVKPNKQGNFVGSDLELLSFETSEENIRYEHKVILRKSDSPEAKSAALLRLEQMTRRRISNKKLQYLNRILTTYANDYDSKYPDRLEQIKPYDTDEWLDWLLENIEYLGKGKTLTETSKTVIAYDKTLLGKAGSTNVLFNDGPVQYCNPVASSVTVVKGLKAVASCRDVVTVGLGGVIVEMYLQNVGDKEITYVDFKKRVPIDEFGIIELLVDNKPVGNYAILDVSENGYKNIIGTLTSINVATRSGIVVPIPPIPREAFVVLKPGEKVAYLKVDLQPAHFEHEDSKQALGPLQIPGEHIIQVEYQNSATGRQFGLNAWTGKLRSNVVTVRVKLPRSLDEIKPEISNLLSKLQRLENEHLKIIKTKQSSISKSERKKLMTTNMAVMSGLEKELRRLSEETARQLVAYGEPSVPILLEELWSLSWESDYGRGCIGDALRQIGRPAVPYLLGPAPAVEVAHGKYEKVVTAKYKRVIVSTLGQIGDSRAVEPLLALFEKNKRAAIRWTYTIATALGLIGDKRAVEPLISELDACLARAEKNSDWDAERLVMRACVGALGRIGDKRAIAVLKRALQARPQKTKAGLPKYLIAEAAAAALRQLGVKVQGKKGDYRFFETAPPSQKPDETKQERPDGARVIYVDADADGANNGSSWVDAYRYLQDVLAAARRGDEIRVAQGVYKPDQGKGQALGDRQRTFRFGHTIIKGGYAGFGSFDPNERDIARYETVLSGDLNGDDGTDFANTDDNSSRVVTNLDGALLDGFTITGGNSDSSGAAMVCVAADATISNCIFRNNAAVSGGAMFISGVKPKRIGGKFVGLSVTLINCKFIKNSAMRGGAIVINNSSPNLRDCVFIGNSAVALTSSSGIGGAIRNVFSDPNLINCVFKQNSAQRGGAIFNQQSNPIFEDCTFVGNTVIGTRGAAGIGSAIYNTYSNPTLTGCTFSKNSGDEAGPIHNSESSPILTNCRFDKSSEVAEESSWATPQPEGMQQQRNYEEATNVPQPIELWKVKKFGCGGNPRTMEKLQTDTKRHYPIVLTWPLIQNASKYVVQVKGVRGCRPTTSFESVTNSLRLVKADITPGRYQWAVSVYDRHGKFMGDIEPIDPVEIFAIADPEPVQANGKKVLIDLNHSASHMRGWGYYNHTQYMTKELLENAGFEVEVNERDLLTAERLKSFDLLICYYYWAGWPGFRSYLQSELSAVRQFVDNGGSLLVVGCDRKEGGGKMSKAGNELVKEFGFLFDLDKISQQYGVAETFPGQNVISFGKVIPVQLPVGVEGENAVTLLQFDGAPIAKAQQIGSGKVIVAGAGMSFLDCYLGDFEHREPLHLIMFYDFVRYLTGIDWKKNCRQEFVETILSRCQFREM